MIRIIVSLRGLKDFEDKKRMGFQTFLKTRRMYSYCETSGGDDSRFTVHYEFVPSRFEMFVTRWRTGAAVMTPVVV